jgi:hypothetical protein
MTLPSPIEKFFRLGKIFEVCVVFLYSVSVLLDSSMGADYQLKHRKTLWEKIR